MTDVFLNVDKLGKRFGGLAAVRALSFSVGQGEIVGLIGPNGAGKTTAFNLISGALNSSTGKVSFRGGDISNRSPSMIVSRGLARTFQSTSTYADISVEQNVYRGLISRIKGGAIQRLMRREDELLGVHDVEEEIERILKVVDMESWRHATAGSLAYGLQKKLGIAIALASRPTMLLLDEPAAGLNHEECRELCKLLRTLQEEYGLTMLLVEHHMAVVMELCTRIIVLVRGEKLAEGSPEQIRQNPAVIEAYLGAPEYAHH